ncbi:Ig-like domain-containing protein [Virgibacillus sp. AGTR]|uniref:Ig-like domain-containing protein n=1 Tax=Virgibacillus sp. AGTR TaxID=2812055 RepID=UPI001D164CAC|nr:Ig-like domain-containing protein [Virgibacillus sp. AGTR]MCC2249082.1 Ig-like domain-containing protein [Virgibacillus sp. AGTR]
MATTYKVYRDGNEIANELTEKSFTDSELTPNTTYEYQVSAVNANGESELSAPITVTTDYSDPTAVDVSPKTNNLVVSGTRSLTATVSPDTANPSVNWSSSDEAIATVSSTGEVTAVSTGTATITATSTDDNTVKGTATVNVTQPVTGVSVDPSTAELEVGATQQLTETVSPSNATNKGVTWSSSDEAIATVDSTGLVTAVAEGSATITVTTDDGGKTATSEITVIAASGA